MESPTTAAAKLQKLSDESGILDRDQYRSFVLEESEETESLKQRNLLDEAARLGLDTELVSSSPFIPPSSSCFDRNPRSGLLSDSNNNSNNNFHKRSASLVDVSSSSNTATPSDARSFVSILRRQSSLGSHQGEANGGSHADNGPHGSSINSNNNKKEGRRSLVSSALSRLNLHHSRSHSHSQTSSSSRAPLLPAGTRTKRASTVQGGGSEEVTTTRAEGTAAGNHVQKPDATNSKSEILEVEIPVVYDTEALRRSENDAELAEMVESLRLKRDRHVAFLRASLVQLRKKQEDIVADRQCQQTRLEDEKREKVSFWNFFFF